MQINSWEIQNSVLGIILSNYKWINSSFSVLVKILQLKHIRHKSNE